MLRLKDAKSQIQTAMVDLQIALKEVGAVESLVVTELVKKADGLVRDIERLEVAMAVDKSDEQNECQSTIPL